MRILQVITNLRVGGAEKLIVDISSIMNKMGIHVDVLLFGGENTILKNKLIEEGVSVFSLSNDSIYNPLLIMKLIPYLKKYDIIHTHNTACQYYTAIASCFIKKDLILITTEHSTFNRRREMPLFFYLDKWMYNKYKSIIAISNEVSTSLKYFLKNNLDVEIIYNGIDLNMYSSIDTYDNDGIDISNDIILTMVGGFRREKDQDTIIKSLKYLPEKCILWLVGDGVRRSELQSLAKSYDLEERVVFWGLTNDIPQILRSSHIVILSSHWEGFGLAAVEGMASRKPVVASDVMGLNSVVSNAGLLFENGNAKDLANKVLLLINNKEEYNKIKEKCYARSKLYDINSTVNKYVELYCNVL